MSNAIYVPDGAGGYRLSDEPRREVFKIPEPTIPGYLQEDLDANPHMKGAFYKAVQTALDMSLSDPRTTFRNPTGNAIKERIELCYNTIVTMRYDLAYPLKKCFDLLPQKLMDSLLKGSRVDDEMAKLEGSKHWQREHVQTEALATSSGPDMSTVEAEETENDAIGLANARTLAGVPEPAPRVWKRRNKPAGSSEGA